MKAIMAIDRNGAVGNSLTRNKLPWDLPEELAHFKKQTDGCTLLVGWRTFSDLPDLNGRNLLVDMREHRYPKDVLDNVDWCIGGPTTFKKYWDDIDEWVVSFIVDEHDADVYWKDFEVQLIKDFQLHDVEFNEGYVVVTYRRR